MVGLSYLLYSLINTNALILLKLIGDQDLSVAFGLARAFILVFLDSLGPSNSEVLAMIVARFYGSRRPDKVKIAFTNSLLFMALTNILYWVFIYFIYAKILQLLHLNERIIELSCQIMYMYCPFFTVYLLNNILGCYLIAQGVSTGSYILILPSALLSIGLMYFLYYYCSLKIGAFFISATIFELFNLAVFLWMYFTKIDDEYKGVAGLTTALRYCCSYFKDFSLFAFTYVVEIAGWEIMIYFSLLSGNDDSVICIQSVMNVATYIIFFSYGFSDKSASVIGILLGAKLKKAARKFATIYVMGMLLLGMIIGSLIFVCSDYISKVFVDKHTNPDLYLMIKNTIKIYALWAPQDLIIKWIMGTARILSLGWVLFTTTLLFPIIGQCALCYYFYHRKGRVSALTVLNISYSMYCVVAVTMLLIFAIMDWEKIHHEPPEYALTDEVDILNENTEMDKKRAELKQDIN